MTRFVVDVSAVVHLAGAGIEIPGVHKLLAPTLLDVVDGECEMADARGVPRPCTAEFVPGPET
jgi:hypothetical protein